MDDPASIAVRYAKTPLPRKPRLVPWITVVDLGDKRLQFRAQEFAYTLQNPLFIDLLQIIKPLLDGNHTVDEITVAGGPRFFPTTVSFFLKMLRSHGLLQEGDGSSHPSLTPQDLERNDGSLRFLSHFEAIRPGRVARSMFASAHPTRSSNKSPAAAVPYLARNKHPTIT